MREHVGEPPLSLTRRRVGRFHGIVNRGPAKCYSLPDTDRQGRGCARGLACGARAILLECFAFIHACCLTRCVKQNGLREAAFLFRRRSGSPVARSQWPCGYRTWWVHFGLARFFVAIPTEDEGTRKRGTESAARCGRVFAWTYWLCNVFRGEYAGAKGGSRTAAAPDCAKETSLPGLSSFDSRCGCVSRGEGRSGTTKA